MFGFWLRVARAKVLAASLARVLLVMSESWPLGSFTRHMFWSGMMRAISRLPKQSASFYQARSLARGRKLIRCFVNRERDLKMQQLAGSNRGRRPRL